MNLPTCSNPLILTWVNRVDNTRSIPSLKNRRQPVIRNNRLLFITNSGVQKFMKSMEKSLVQQWTRSGFNTIQLPHRVCVYTVVAKYVTKEDVVPVSDLDNQYTTVQEMLQNGLILEDDKQVAAFFADEKLVFNRDHQYAKCYLWVDDGTPRFEQFANLYQTLSQPQEIEVIPSLLSLIMEDEYG